jgi:murein DD-endopeptidase MepM/ murein hydrolase activator NlpD
MNQLKMELISILQNSQPSPVMGIALSEDNCMPIALNTFKTELLHLKDRSKTSLLQIYMDEKRKVLNKTFAAGGYLEDRSWYARSPLFGSERSVHLGIDIWADAGQAVFSPYEGKIHSFADNAGFGNYGPTLVIEHEIMGMTFYTLYGHLSRTSMTAWEQGKAVFAGQEVGTLGEIQENGEWPAHLHFQIISDLQGNNGDFPGVCMKEDVKLYKNICPDPNLVLRIPGL